MKILVICTGNSCRSQMTEGILKSLNPALEVYSAGTRPAHSVSRMAVAVLKEIGIDISTNYPKSIDEFAMQDFDYVITVCGDARDNCPVFAGSVKHRLHIGFEDPSTLQGSDDYRLEQFRKVRDKILYKMKIFLESIK